MVVIDVGCSSVATVVTNDGRQLELLNIRRSVVESVKLKLH